MKKKVLLALSFIFMQSAYSNQVISPQDLVYLKGQFDWLHQRMTLTNEIQEAEQNLLDVLSGKSSSSKPDQSTPKVTPEQPVTPKQPVTPEKPLVPSTPISQPTSSKVDQSTSKATPEQPVEQPVTPIVAYYENWARYAPDGNEEKRPVFVPSMIDIESTGINVINYAFICPYPNAISTLYQDVTSEQAEANVKEHLDKLTDLDLTSEETFRAMMSDVWADVDSKKSKTSEENSFHELHDLKANNPNLKVMMSFGGWTLSAGFPAATSTDVRRAKMATLMVNFVKYYKFDGIDIDWEYPGWEGHAGTPADKANFVAFLTELSKQARANGLLLTLAVGADPVKVKNGMDLVNIHELVDWMSLMCYDYNGPWGQKYTGHNAPLYADPNAPGGDDNPYVKGTFNVAAAVDLYLGAGVPATKLVLGMPLYGRSFAGVKDDKDNGGLYGTGALTAGIGTVQEGVVSLSDIMQNYLKKEDSKEDSGYKKEDSGYKSYRDDVSKVPYLYNASTGDWVSYDDYNSLAAKAQFAKSKGLRGGMVWPIEAGDEYKKAIKTIKDNL